MMMTGNQESFFNIEKDHNIKSCKKISSDELFDECETVASIINE